MLTSDIQTHEADQRVGLGVDASGQGSWAYKDELMLKVKRHVELRKVGKYPEDEAAWKGAGCWRRQEDFCVECWRIEEAGGRQSPETCTFFGRLGRDTAGL